MPQRRLERVNTASTSNMSSDEQQAAELESVGLAANTALRELKLLNQRPDVFE